jgi:hypothetical protein
VERTGRLNRNLAGQYSSQDGLGNATHEAMCMFDAHRHQTEHHNAECQPHWENCERWSVKQDDKFTSCLLDMSLTERWKVEDEEVDDWNLVPLDRVSVRESVQVDLPLRAGKTSEYQCHSVRTVETV